MADPLTYAPKTQHIGWHYWQLAVPKGWNPVQLDGDYVSGSVLFADLGGPRLGVRWTTCNANAAAAAERAMRDEVGAEAAAKAADFPMTHTRRWPVSRLGASGDQRQLWVGFSPQSNRLFQIVHHPGDLPISLRENILCTFADRPTDRPFFWKIFDLTFTTPAGWHVRSSRFLAGDQSVLLTTPRRGSRELHLVRQVGPASLALARQPLEKWLPAQPFSTPKLYRSIAGVEPITLRGSGRTLEGMRGTLRRKRRLWWAWFVASTQTVIGCRDAERNRLVFAQGADVAVLSKLLETVGSVPNARTLSGDMEHK